MAILNNNPLIGASGQSTGAYKIERSLRFNSADSAYLSRTPGSAGNRQIWTWSAWVKRSTIGSDDQQLLSAGGSGGFQFLFDVTSSSLRIYDILNSTTDVITTQVFRDVSAWYHVVLATDTTQATASNRFKLYINGTQVTSFSTTTYPAQNSTLSVNNTAVHAIGSWSGSGGGDFFGGYMADVHLIDGSALTPSSFGENDTDTGVWKPKAYTGSYGTNGFKLTFSDNSGTTATTLGKDTSGNGNNWTPNNFSVTAGAGNDSLVDTPTPYGTDTGAGGEVRGNYCTWNPLDKSASISTLNGNLDAYVASGSWFSARATFGISSGKWYWECTPNNSTAMVIGIGTSQASLATYVGGDAYGWAYFNSNGNKFNNNISTSYGASYTTNDVMGVAFDADAGTLTFYKNGVSQGTAFTGLTNGPYFPMVGIGGTLTVATNFGQRPFAYTAPSGFKALCTTNLPTPAIGATSTTRADDYFNTVLYTGNGSTQTVSGVGFQPDLVWVKQRSSSVGANWLNDAVRGAGNSLSSNRTDAEAAYSAYFTAFNSDGFALAGGTDGFNANTSTYVGWNWKANGAGSSNTAGSINSAVSANTTAGFSIVTYTGTGANATIGHGLGVAPSMIIVKSRGAVTEWAVGHSGLTSWGYFLKLNSTVAQASASVVWNNTAPTSTVFSVGSEPDVNSNGGNYVAYCFAQVSSYSSFGSYTGNGSSDGPFIYTGFRPAFVLIKARGLSESWQIVDSDRSDYNVVDKALSPNNSNAEGTGTTIYRDFLSNGFKIRTSDSSQNTNGQVYIYAAFAENPFKYSLAR